jgi:hypothetical protein
MDSSISRKRKYSIMILGVKRGVLRGGFRGTPPHPVFYLFPPTALFKVKRGFLPHKNFVFAGAPDLPPLKLPQMGWRGVPQIRDL